MGYVDSDMTTNTTIKSFMEMDELAFVEKAVMLRCLTKYSDNEAELLQCLSQASLYMHLIV